jgi:ABC-type glutathione transport system ATPase component
MTLELPGVGRVAHMRPYEMSGGERVKAVVARAPGSTP